MSIYMDSLNDLTMPHIVQHRCACVPFESNNNATVYTKITPHLFDIADSRTRAH